MAFSNAPIIPQAISSALTLVAPLFALALLVWAITHPPPTHAQSKQKRNEAFTAYIAIGSLAVLCAVDAALGLSTVLGSARGAGLGMGGRGEAVVEALVFLELGASVIYLANEHLIHGLKVYWVIALVIELVCATTVSLIYSPLESGVVSPFLPPILSLLFTVTVLPVLGFNAIRVHITKQSTNNAQTSPMTEIRTPSFSGTRLSGQTNSIVSPTSSGSSSLPRKQEKISPKSSLSDFTAVNHYRDYRVPRNGHVDTNTLESGMVRHSYESTGERMNRSTGLLVSLVASQVAAFFALILQIAAVKVGLAVSLNLAPSATGTGDYTFASLQIARTILMALCITGVMSALLLHAYNVYLGPALTGRQSIADLSILPPVVDLSRMNAITVSLSATAATSPALTATKKRSSGEPYVPSFDRAAKKFRFKTRITDVVFNAANDQTSLKESTGLGLDTSIDEENQDYPRKAKEPPSRHGYSASASSSFACTMAKIVPVPSNSTTLPVEFKQEGTHCRTAERNSELNDDEDGEPGYAYIYADSQVFSSSRNHSNHSMDPLHVGRPSPFRHRQHLPSFSPSPSSKHVSLQPSHSDSVLTNQAVENSISSTSPSSPPSATQAIEIPVSKHANPYPTPRSTPTATAFIDLFSSPNPPDSPVDSALPSQTPRPVAVDNSDSKPNDCWTSDPQDISSSENHSRDTDRTSSCSAATHIPFRTSTPTPTPTRAPTPGLSSTPFLGSQVRKRDPSGSRSERQLSSPPSPPSPPSAFITHLKGKAKTLSTKHESISESLAQGLEGIRHGLGGSNGRTKYPLRSSTSQGSLGLGLGISSGFKFPQLTRRASEMDHLRIARNGSTSTLAVTAEGIEPEEDFMDLRDPFACPNVKEGGALRIVSQAELSLMGRESRAGYRDDDGFDAESSHRGSGVGSSGKARGARMSAWGKLPMPPSCSSSVSSTPHSKRYRRSTSPAPSPTCSPAKSKHRSERKGKSKSKSSKANSSCSGSAESAGSYSHGVGLPPMTCLEDGDFVCEEALIAQQLLMKLDEKLWAASESATYA